MKIYIDEEFAAQCIKIMSEYSEIYLSQIGVTETLINLRKRLAPSTALADPSRVPGAP